MLDPIRWGSSSGRNQAGAFGRRCPPFALRLLPQRQRAHRRVSGASGAGGASIRRASGSQRPGQQRALAEAEAQQVGEAVQPADARRARSPCPPTRVSLPPRTTRQAQRPRRPGRPPSALPAERVPGVDARARIPPGGSSGRWGTTAASPTAPPRPRVRPARGRAPPPRRSRAGGRGGGRGPGTTRRRRAGARRAAAGRRPPRRSTACRGGRWPPSAGPAGAARACRGRKPGRRRSRAPAPAGAARSSASNQSS